MSAPDTLRPPYRAHLSGAAAADMSACRAVRTWQHHLLISYYHAALAVILAQFSHKGFTDGMAGVIELAEASSYLQVRVSTSIQLDICATS